MCGETTRLLGVTVMCGETAHTRLLGVTVMCGETALLGVTVMCGEIVTRVYLV